MTDDRARRIREMRNRTTGGDGSGSSEPDETDDDPDDANGTRTGADATDDGETADVASPAGDCDERPSASGRDPPGQASTGSGSPADSPPDHGSTSADDPAETAPSDDTEATADDDPTRGDRADQRTVESALGGAIADSSSVPEFADDVGTEKTVDSSAVVADPDGAGEESVGSETGVFERGNTLMASTHDDDTTVQMFEFHLNDNRYAIEIERISAIVEIKEITRFPRGPEAIDGVTDLRGEITAVLDPTVMLDVERSELSDDQYIVVLERSDDKQKLGIRVTDVSQAVTYRESRIDETGSVMDTTDHQHEFINGIIKKTIDDRTVLVTWLDIDGIIETTGQSATPA